MMTRLALCLIALMLIGLLPVSVGWQKADAQAAKENPQKPKVRRSEALGKMAFGLVEDAQSLAAEEKHDEALAVLQGIIDGERFKPFEKAVAIQNIGFVYADKGDYPQTLAAFERAIATDRLPPRMVSELTYNLAQLHLAEGRAQEALTHFSRWTALIDGEPMAAAFALQARIHLALDDFPKAETAIRRALSKAKEPQQNWTRILLSVLLQQERHAEARPILEDAVERWPNVKAFWQQLTAVYYEAEEEELGFIARRAMHVQGMLTGSKELSGMAQLYLYHGVPIKAAQLLQSGLDDGSIDRTEENLELLARAYMYAREWSKSVEPLTEAAEMSDKGKLYAQLAQAHLQNEAWAQAEVALEKALAKGGLDDAADNWLLLGIARERLKKYEAAISAFRKAGDDDALAKDAFRRIRAVERRLAESKRAESRP